MFDKIREYIMFWSMVRSQFATASLLRAQDTTKFLNAAELTNLFFSEQCVAVSSDAVLCFALSLLHHHLFKFRQCSLTALRNGFDPFTGAGIPKLKD